MQQQAIQKPLVSFSVMSFAEVKEHIQSIMDIYDVGYFEAIQIWFWPEKGYDRLVERVHYAIQYVFDNELQRDSSVRVLSEFLVAGISSTEAQHIRLEVISRLSHIDRIIAEEQEWLVGTVASFVDAYVGNGGSARIAICAIEPSLFCLMNLRSELMLKYLNKDAAAQEYQRMAITVLGSNGFQYGLSKFGHSDHCDWARNRLDYAYGWLLKAEKLLQELKNESEAGTIRPCVFINVLLDQIRATDLEITTQWNLPPKEWPEAL